MLGAASTIAVVTLASRVVGFGRWLVFSKEVGGTCVGQAYATANQLPNVLYEVAAGGALAAVVVPLVAGAVEAGDKTMADRIASVLLTWAVAVLMPLSILLALLADPVAAAMTGSAEDECGTMRELTSAMLVLFAPQVLLYGVGIVFAGVLQAHRRFLAAALAPLLSSLVVIAAYLIYGSLADPAGASVGVAERVVLAGGTTLGVVALSVPLLIPLRRIGVRLQPALSLPSDTARRARQLSGAGLIALVAQQGAVLVTIALANDRGGVGAVNVYNYVQALYLLPYALLAVPVATAAFPRLAGASGEQVLSRVLPLVGFAGILAGAVLIAVAGPVGAFFRALDARPESMEAMTAAVVAFAPGLVGFSLVALLSRALYVHGRAPAAGAAVAAGWVVAGLGPVLLLDGVADDSRRTLVVLGACSSAGMTVAAAALFALVRKDWGARVCARALGAWARALVAGAVAAGSGVLLARAMEPMTRSLGGAVLVGLTVALASLLLFGMIVSVIDRRAVREWTAAVRRGGAAA